VKGRVAVLFLMALTAGTLWADLAAIKAEPNLEKRSKLALDHAESTLKAAREAYGKGEEKQTEALLDELRDSVELAQASLKETGKNPRKNPKWFKRAEIQTRDLLRKLEAFDQEMSVVDRPLLAEAKKTVQQVHDDLLRGVMEGKPR
jgi:hypothetical protein